MAEQVLQCLSPHRFMEVGIPLPQQEQDERAQEQAPSEEDPVKPTIIVPYSAQGRKWALIAFVGVVFVSCGIVYMMYLSGHFDEEASPNVGGSNHADPTAAPSSSGATTTTTTVAPSTISPDVEEPPVISPMSPTILLYPSPAPWYTISTPQTTLQPTSEPPPPQQGIPLAYTGWCSPETTCFECQGQCFSNEDCFGNLVCFIRAGFAHIPGCAGSGIYGVSYCHQSLLTNEPTLVPSTTFPTRAPVTLPPTEPVLNFNGDCSAGVPCGLCQGDCDDDSHCAANLVCFQRNDDTDIPGCVGTAVSGKDYCILSGLVQPTPDPTARPTMPPTPFPTRRPPILAPTSRSPTLGPTMPPFQPPTLEQVVAAQPQPTQTSEPVLYGTGDCSPTFPCRLCQGDCDSDDDCVADLKCFLRGDSQSVPGCSGGGINGKDYCYDSISNIFENALQANADCTISQPCDECQGDCTQDADCKENLVCFRRTLGGPVPGCVSGGGGDIAQANYCHEPLGGGPVSFIPGDLTVNENGLLLSTGLTARIIARYGEPVSYDTGGQSTIPFHKDPDAAAVFETLDGGWIYVSNSEDVPGGVGAIRFNSDGGVIDYRMIATNSTDNCGGGKTWWNTWLTCEEKTDGYVHEVDPWGIKPERIVPLMGSGRLESAAYYRPTPDTPTFYITEDIENGALRRFTPDGLAVATANSRNDFSELLHSNETGTAKIEFLKLNAQTSNSGTFYWTQDRSAARQDARQYYSFSEGIDIARGVIYVTAKNPKKLLMLNIEQGTWERTSTESGAFSQQPDQVKFILGDNAQDDVLFFCEDGGENSGVHGRDSQGNFYNVLNGRYDSETTGLAFSPDNTRMYVSFQENPGLIFEVKRRDGYPFAGSRLDIKYSRVKS